MELWIRTQTNRTLVKVNHIAIREEDTLVYYGNDLDLDKYVTLGKYETKERALEILDEIQGLLKGNILPHHINKFDIYNGENIKVYEMPET